MCFADVDADGRMELLVGSDDYEIRAFGGEEVLSEITEADRVTALNATHGSRFSYALANGTVGLYDRQTRVWRVKSKNMVMSVQSFDMDQDGVPEVVVGWSNGRVEVRRERNGEVMMKDTLPGGVAAIEQGDYRMDGREEVIVCGQDGEVRGYLPVEGGASFIESKAGSSGGVGGVGGVSGGGGGGGGSGGRGSVGGGGGSGGSGGGGSGGVGGGGDGGEDQGFHDLLQRKQELLLELKGLEANVKELKTGDMGAGMIDPRTQVSVRGG
jgi:hypothetical protein